VGDVLTDDDSVAEMLVVTLSVVEIVPERVPLDDSELEKLALIDTVAEPIDGCASDWLGVGVVDVVVERELELDVEGDWSADSVY